jgi:UDP-N-acetylmuramate dehydrogenase
MLNCTYSNKQKNKNILLFLKKKNISYKKDFSLKKKSWLKAGGVFELYIQPKTLEEIKQLIEFFYKNRVKFYTVGNLSNIIFRDGVIRTPIINLRYFNHTNIIYMKNDTVKITAESGISIYKFVNLVTNNLKISCLEGLIGIPGTLGGAIYMNASSYGSFISQYLKEVEIINSNSELIKFKKEEIEFDWRSTKFHTMKDFIILNALFEFPKKNIKSSEFITSNVDKIKNHRTTFQEKKYPNLGSLFATKNLYADISRVNLFFYFLDKLNNVLSRVILKFFNKKYLLVLRKNLVKIYSLFFGISKNDPFILSDKTINCLINNGSCEANEAIKIIRKIQKKIKNTQKLENIIIDKID